MIACFADPYSSFRFSTLKSLSFGEELNPLTASMPFAAPPAPARTPACFRLISQTLGSHSRPWAETRILLEIGSCRHTVSDEKIVIINIGFDHLVSGIFQFVFQHQFGAFSHQPNRFLILIRIAVVFQILFEFHPVRFGPGGPVPGLTIS